jgi:hypothetical protein
MHDPVLEDEVKDKGLNINSDDDIPLIIGRALSPKEEDKYKILYHDTPIPGPLMDPERIVSNVIRILGLRVKTGL